MKPGELVTAIELPNEDFSANYTYLKLRDRLSYAFALVSVAVALKIENGVIATARVALGGVAHKPWRRPEAEALLQGKPASLEHFAAAANALLEGAAGQGDNDFKIAVGASSVIVRALLPGGRGHPAVADRQAHRSRSSLSWTDPADESSSASATPRIDGGAKVTGKAPDTRPSTRHGRDSF